MNKILVTRIGGIGDVVMTTAVVAGLKCLYPHSHIAYLVAPSAVDAVAGLPFIDEVIPFRKDFRTQVSIIRKIWRFDLALHADVTYRPAILSALARIRVRVGLAHKRGQWLTYPIAWQKYMDAMYDPAMVAEWLKMATGIDVTQTKSWSNLFYAEATAAEKTRTKSLLTEAGVNEPYIVAAPYASGAAKDWPMDRWMAFFALVRKHISVPIVLVGDKPIPGDLPQGVFDLTRKTNLRELGYLIQQASFLIGGCSLPMHVARAFNIPSIGLYGPNPVTKGAPPELIAAHVTNFSCAPCEGYYSGACDKPDCMQSIEPKDVFEDFYQWWRSHKERK